MYDIGENLLDRVGILADHAEGRVVLVVYFVKLVESRDFVEDSVNEHIEKIVNEHDADDLRDQLGGLWERLPVASVADV